jgi:hypothetical protein
MKGHIKERLPGRFAIILEARDRQRASASAAGTNMQAPSGRLRSNAPSHLGNSGRHVLAAR